MNSILIGQNKDTDTILSIKKDTANISSIKKDTTSILDKLEDEKRAKRYGYRIKKSESDPSARVEYLYDAVGMTPAHMNYETDTFDYGSWANIWFVKNNYPVMVNYSGIEVQRLNPNDYSKKLNQDGTSDYNNANFEGNAMSAIPLCWVKRYEEGDYEYVIFCEQQYDESYKAYAHTAADGTIKPVAYHAMFKGSMISNKLRSIAGQVPQSGTNTTAEMTAASANGSNWYIRSWSMQQLIADLLTLMAKTDDSETAFGHGVVSTYVNDASKNYGMVNTGGLYNKGQFYGKGDDTHQVKVFHIEDFWGNRWDRICGLLQSRGSFMVKMTPEGSGYNITGEGYVALGSPYSMVKQEHQWIKNTFQSEYGRVPYPGAGGSNSTYVCDFFWINAEYNGFTLALCGGGCKDGLGCGSRCLNLVVAAGSAVWFVGASLTYI